MAEELALVELLGHGSAVHPDQRALRAIAATVELAGHELLAGSRFAEDQHRGVRRGDLLDLRPDLADRGTRPDDLAERVAFADLLAKVLVLELELLAQLCVLFESTRVRNGCGSVVGQHAQGVERFAVEAAAREHPQHAQHLAVVGEGLTAEPEDALVPGPLGPREPPGILARVLDADGLVGRGDGADLSLPDREAPEVAVDAGPVGRAIGDGLPRAHCQMQAGDVPGAGFAHRARGADVAASDEPDPRQGDVRVLPDPSHDELEKGCQGPLACEVEEEAPDRLEGQGERRGSHLPSLSENARRDNAFSCRPRDLVAERAGPEARMCPEERRNWLLGPLARIQL